MRLGLSATAAAAALYGAVILFGVGPATPSALDPNGDLRTPVVHLPRDSAVSGPALRLPQASPGPDRQRSGKAPPPAAGIATAVPAPEPKQSEPAIGPAPLEPAQPAASPASPPSAPPQSVEVSLLKTTLPEPDVAMPPVPLPPAHELPPLPPTPSLPFP